MKRSSLFILIFLGIGMGSAESAESVYHEPEGLVRGGAFIDRFLPVPLRGKLRSDVWGAANVVPRDVNNGIEDAEYSYWGGNIIAGDDGKNHLFVCRWPEDNVKGGGKASGHHTWWSSEVVHAVSDDPLGPYKVVDTIGKGHNPEIYQTAAGTWYIGVMGKKAYRAESLEGPWEQVVSTFDRTDVPKHWHENRTYVAREDGSVLAMCKAGTLWLSEKGDENFHLLTEESAYTRPPQGHYEDPVIWRDEVQYHLVYNDWYGRVAYYKRSPDGIHWTTEPGIAFTPEIMKHEGGTQEKWYKFERPKVRQDQYGRATHMNFAVIDVIKDNDLANDNHSSKNIVIPLVVPRRLQILNTEPITAGTKKIRVRILAEDGFDPVEEVDLKSLTFGAPKAVDFGRGFTTLKSETAGKDLIVTFAGSAHEITADNFAAKLIGRTKSGALLFGYAKLSN
ncbi:glycoside hydrolase family protein [Pontiella agarivorans]|uniref:Glycoside hydrolase family protein n=1 Tax=Pontiella agarivorans TaxID=3038953 RepID=A0ABU5N0M6_9BACT|nr:glycoside hydrolase family protein [Pontiella agarivorans]MDZ8120002.1 glycoside hydrolase family protein [Pontiella agarivorans]